MSKYESWLNSELAVRKRAILNRVAEIEQITANLRCRVESDSYLNELGELQAAGVMLDTAVSSYATMRQALKNYQVMKE